MDSRTWIIWKDRNASIDQAMRIWVPRIASIFKSAAEHVETARKLTDNITTILSTLDLSLTPLNLTLRSLYEETEQHFIYRRGEQVKGTNLTPSDYPLLADWTQEAISMHLDMIERATLDQTKKEVLSGNSDLTQAYTFSIARAETIARVEIAGAANAATHFSLGAEYGINRLTKSWISVGDDATRPNHAQLNLVNPIPFETPFTLGQQQVLFPGDTSLGAQADEIVNCRCMVGYQSR